MPKRGKRHNPERRTWRGKSGKKAGNGPATAQRVRELRDKTAREADDSEQTAKPDHERLSHYVEGFFARSGNTEWPTVRQAARALGWRLARVEATCDGDPGEELFLSSHFTTPPEPLAEHFVERYNPLPKTP